MTFDADKEVQRAVDRQVIGHINGKLRHVYMGFSFHMHVPIHRFQ